ncbi:hypothetical protein BH11MYX1_BH11MYX1_45260 [soil metagenome]
MRGIRIVAASRVETCCGELAMNITKERGTEGRDLWRMALAIDIRSGCSSSRGFTRERVVQTASHVRYGGGKDARRS